MAPHTGLFCLVTWAAACAAAAGHTQAMNQRAVHAAARRAAATRLDLRRAHLERAPPPGDGGDPFPGFALKNFTQKVGIRHVAAGPSSLPGLRRTPNAALRLLLLQRSWTPTTTTTAAKCSSLPCA